MRCAYYEAGRCGSCTLLPVPYAEQLANKQATVAAALPAGIEWLAPQASAEWGFRNKAKMVAAGAPGRVSLGILDTEGAGIDLTGCELHEQPLRDALPVLSDWVQDAGLTPYSVTERTGELKHILLTASPVGELMARFVLRSEGQAGRIRRHLPELQAALPGLRVATVNLQPEHKAVLEGAEEYSLGLAEELAMPLGAVTLRLGPRSFFQTNTAVTRSLYAQASAWSLDGPVESLWDLYCGVGGFALHLAEGARAGGRAPRVVGVEVSPDAVASAHRTAAELGLDAEFVAADATQMAALGYATPDLAIVNPPRRGIGPLADWLEAQRIPRVLYSSCNPATLAADLARMPSYAPVRARLFDMFPHTGHAEVLVELRRA